MPPPPLPGSEPPPIPSAEPAPVEPRQAPPTGRKFPCRQCGAKLDFDPAARGLKCPYCGYTEVIPEADDDAKAEVQEHDLEAFLSGQKGRGDAKIRGHASEVRCGGCGAVVILDDKVHTDRCPYCATHLENKPEAVKDLIAPESVLPFAVTDREAKAAFNTWLHSLWFAPTELKKLANLGRFASVYAPYWTYDAMTYTRYSGQRGDNYTETEWYTDSNGNRQTRTVTKIRWTFVSGEVRHFFDDVVVPASKTLPAKLVAKLPPWGLKELEAFRDEFLSGHATERYSVSLKEGFDEAKGIMEDHITGLIRRDIGGDHQRISTRKTRYVGVTFKHALFPTWVASYRYRERLFQVLVNGRTAKVAGDRPWSVWKIVRLILLILIAVGLIAFVVSLFSGDKQPGPGQNGPGITAPADAPHNGDDARRKKSG